jgi:hypothetical protein
MAFVADNSIVVAWFVESQSSEGTAALLDRAASEDVHVPSIWRAEFAAALPLRLRLPLAARDRPLRRAAERVGLLLA